jgi:nucleotide-binding universal stress UspA family protein
MIKLQTILHPTDFSERSGHAFRLACSLARDHGARLVVLHVVPPPIAYGEVLARNQSDNFYDEMWEDLRRIQPDNPQLKVDHYLEEGHADEVIVRLARELPADLIVMGTHGRTGLGRLLVGSVAEQVMRHAPCPVLTLKTPLPEGSEEPAPRQETAQA